MYIPGLKEALERDMHVMMIYAHRRIHWAFATPGEKAAAKITCFFKGHSYMELHTKKICFRCLKEKLK